MDNHSKYVVQKVDEAKKSLTSDIEKTMTNIPKLAVMDNAAKILHDNDNASLGEMNDNMWVLSFVLLLFFVPFASSFVVLTNTFCAVVATMILSVWAGTLGSSILRSLGYIDWYSNIRNFIKLRKSSWTRRDVLNAIERNEWNNPCVEKRLSSPQQYRVLTETDLSNIHNQVNDWNDATCTKAWMTMLERQGAPIRQRDIECLLDIKCLVEQQKFLNDAEQSLQNAVNIFKARAKDKEETSKVSNTKRSDTIQDPQQTLRNNILQSIAVDQNVVTITNEPENINLSSEQRKSSYQL